MQVYCASCLYLYVDVTRLLVGDAMLESVAYKGVEQEGWNTVVFFFLRQFVLCLPFL